MRPCLNGVQLRIRNSILLVLHTNIFTVANLILPNHGNNAINRYDRIYADKLPEYPNVCFDGTRRFTIPPPIHRTGHSRRRGNIRSYETFNEIASKSADPNQTHVRKVWRRTKRRRYFLLEVWYTNAEVDLGLY
jgi:hypothetical protein